MVVLGGGHGQMTQVFLLQHNRIYHRTFVRRVVLGGGGHGQMTQVFLLQHNRIHHGKRSGVVVLGSGRGHIRNNSIYSNTEAGIYILYGGNPTVR